MGPRYTYCAIYNEFKRIKIEFSIFNSFLNIFWDLDNMKDYWSELELNECWSEKQRYNKILNYIFGEDENEENNTSDTNNNDTDNIEQQQVQKGTVSVNVTDGENGIGNVSVVLSQDGNETTYTCPNGTGGAGGCNIVEVPYGEYDVTATCEGYETEETTVNVNAETVELDITLTLATVEQTEEPTG